jgi:Kdo2-lipid IVA lauroyltransferase/acyltransferase
MTDIAPIPKMPLATMLRYRAEAAIFFGLIGFFGLFSLDRASGVGGWIGRNVLYRTSVSQRGRDNLKKAYPEKSGEEIEAILLEMWDSLGRTIAEYAHLDKLSLNGGDPRLEARGIDIVENALATGKGVMFVSGHFANWETMPFAAAQYGVEGGEVYRPLNNPYVDRWMVRQRMKHGPKDQIAKGAQGTRRIFTLLRSNKAIFMLVDQKTNEGLPAPFFGRDAMTTPAPAALALKLDCIILPTRNERLGGARFRMTVGPPVEFVHTGNHEKDIQQLTIKITQRVEEMVRARPSQWLWIHRRWPKPGDKLWSKRAKALLRSDGSAAS